MVFYVFVVVVIRQDSVTVVIELIYALRMSRRVSDSLVEGVMLAVTAEHNREFKCFTNR